MTVESRGATTAYDRLAAHIREQILSGELRAGHQLPTESELSDHYQVSRNTAREAVRALASQGLVMVKRGVGGGTFVTRPTPAQISESLRLNLALLADGTDLTVRALVDIREMLEVPAAEIAARNRSEEELAAIRETLFDPVDVNPKSVFSDNRSFHLGVLRATHNPLMEMMAEPVFRVLQERFLRERASEDFWVQVDHDHREIFGHLESGDQAGAREATRAHLRYLRIHYEAIDRNKDEPAPKQ
ncbi:FadR/GntR family transcriptional regulator [Amycolatopsis pithecellobii]|uniref:GntR family transcriptional regulator n=1 Tax=Amycolatopsis pithecellobii TaxID=664692 RepID=A0A6N7Z857_9PSEU|nr:GntR family transcriptional regulator [Amycolatopsis pithecellobii]MTD57560.1 GntR family transcriptional regulator [Amycolatopsis pithecellobii]